MDMNKISDVYSKLTLQDLMVDMLRRDMSIWSNLSEKDKFFVALILGEDRYYFDTKLNQIKTIPLNKKFCRNKDGTMHLIDITEEDKKFIEENWSNDFKESIQERLLKENENLERRN